MENKQLNLSEPENIMGTMDVNPLLIKLSIPMMISMLVQALYNVVDSIFVARVSENALTAVSLAFSLQNLMFAVGIGTGVGVNALLSKSLGEKNQYRANKTAENGLFLALCSYLVFLVLGLTVVRPYFYAQTADADIAEQGIRYLTICCVLSLGMFMQVMNEKLLAATSRTTLSMISQLVGAVVNIILDPLFIFGYCGEALSGTTGAALATVIGQFCGAGVSFYLNLRKNPDIQLEFKGFRPSAEAIKRIYVVGLPSIAMQCVGSVMTFLMNQILMAFTATAVAVFGVYFKLQSFVFMPIFGMNNGMVPIIGYNYGARKPDRVKKTIKCAMFYAEMIMLVGFLLFQFLPDKLLGLFSASEAMLAIGCIQAQKCHTDTCPTGVATQNPWLARGLDPARKAVRAANYIGTLRRDLMKVAEACGVEHPGLISTDAVEILDGRTRATGLADVYGYRPGWGLPSAPDRETIIALMTGTVPQGGSATPSPDATG